MTTVLLSKWTNKRVATTLFPNTSPQLSSQTLFSNNFLQHFCTKLLQTFLPNTSLQHFCTILLWNISLQHFSTTLFSNISTTLFSNISTTLFSNTSAILFSNTSLFFCAHAVRARSSDGHKNVLSLIGYSHILENRWEGKLGVNENETNNTNKTQTKTHNKSHLEN